MSHDAVAPIPTMRWLGHCLELVDQTRLPHEAVMVACPDAAAVGRPSA